MNKKQKIVIIGGIVILMLIFLFPICEKVSNHTSSFGGDRNGEIRVEDRKVRVEYSVSFIALNPDFSEIVPLLLLGEILIIALTALGLFFIFKDVPKRSDS
jgi:hypothetical protein